MRTCLKERGLQLLSQLLDNFRGPVCIQFLHGFLPEPILQLLALDSIGNSRIARTWVSKDRPHLDVHLRQRGGRGPSLTA